MQFIQQIERVVRRFDPPPIYSPLIQAERHTLEAEIMRAQEKLESLRVKEIDLREELVATLDSLQFNAGRASLKIQTRQWEDGNPALDGDFEYVKEATAALTDCLEEIEHAEWLIQDRQNDLDDATLWEEAAS